MAYFERAGRSSFRATVHVSGAWNTAEQHIAPALGLLVHLVERDRDSRRSDGLLIGRLAFELLGTVPVDVVETEVRVVRPGRTIELVEAVLRHGGRDVVALRAWLVQRGETDRLATTTLPRLPPPEAMPPFDLTTVWPGGFIASAEVRRVELQPGRATSWVRTDVALLDDEASSDLARFAGLLDIANGLTVPVSPQRVAFPNVDLSAHLFREPRGGWVGFDTTVSLGPTGLGLTNSIVHDLAGPVGVVSQCLTVRPAPG